MAAAAGDTDLKQKRSASLIPLTVATQVPAVSKALPNGSVTNSNGTQSGQHNKQTTSTHHETHFTAAVAAQPRAATAVATTAALATAPVAAVVAVDGSSALPAPAEPRPAVKGPTDVPSHAAPQHAQHSMPVQAAQHADLKCNGVAPFQPEQATASTAVSQAANATAVAEQSGADNNALPTIRDSMQQPASGQKQDASQVRMTSARQA